MSLIRRVSNIIHHSPKGGVMTLRELHLHLNPNDTQYVAERGGLKQYFDGHKHIFAVDSDAKTKTITVHMRSKDAASVLNHLENVIVPSVMHGHGYWVPVQEIWLSLFHNQKKVISKDALVELFDSNPLYIVDEKKKFVKSIGQKKVSKKQEGDAPVARPDCLALIPPFWVPVRIVELAVQSTSFPNHMVSELSDKDVQIVRLADRTPVMRRRSDGEATAAMGGAHKELCCDVPWIFQPAFARFYNPYMIPRGDIVRSLQFVPNVFVTMPHLRALWPSHAKSNYNSPSHTEKMDNFADEVMTGNDADGAEGDVGNGEECTNGCSVCCNRENNNNNHNNIKANGPPPPSSLSSMWSMSQFLSMFPSLFETKRAFIGTPAATTKLSPVTLVRARGNVYSTVSCFPELKSTNNNKKRKAKVALDQELMFNVICGGHVVLLDKSFVANPAAESGGANGENDNSSTTAK
eukprot:PhM_4_TR2344/c0_g1_i1/m.3217